MIVQFKFHTVLFFKGPVLQETIPSTCQVTEISETAKERVDLAKALIRAVDKPKPKAKAAAEAKKTDEATGESTTA